MAMTIWSRVSSSLQLEQNVFHVKETNTFQILPGYSSTAFLASFTTNTHSPSNPIVFNRDVFNYGGHYDRTTGIYTVPLDGIYEISVFIRGYSDTEIAAYIVVDNTKVRIFVFFTSLSC